MSTFLTGRTCDRCFAPLEDEEAARVWERMVVCERCANGIARDGRTLPIATAEDCQTSDQIIHQEQSCVNKVKARFQGAYGLLIGALLFVASVGVLVYFGYRAIRLVSDGTQTIGVVESYEPSTSVRTRRGRRIETTIHYHRVSFDQHVEKVDLGAFVEPGERVRILYVKSDPSIAIPIPANATSWTIIRQEIGLVNGLLFTSMAVFSAIVILGSLRVLAKGEPAS